MSEIQKYYARVMELVLPPSYGTHIVVKESDYAALSDAAQAYQNESIRRGKEIVKLEQENAKLEAERDALRDILQTIYDTTTDTKLKSTLVQWLSEQQHGS